MPNDRDAQILQILRREAGKEFFRDGVLAESGLVLLKAKAPQPTVNVQVSDPWAAVSRSFRKGLSHSGPP